jgi:excisionase family DNA binding protein
MTKLQVEPLVLKPLDVAALLQVSRSKVYELIASGEIPSILVGGCVRVRVDELRAYLDDARRRPGAT